MHLSEAAMEDLVAKHPAHFIEDGLELVGRQITIGNYRLDLLFRDRKGTKLIVELQKGTLDRNHLYKILDYYESFKENNPKEFIELMVIANDITSERKRRLRDKGIEFKEITEAEFIAAIEEFGEHVFAKELDTYSGKVNMKNDIQKQKQVASVPAIRDFDSKQDMSTYDEQGSIMNQFYLSLLDRAIRRKAYLHEKNKPAKGTKYISKKEGTLGYVYTALADRSRVDISRVDNNNEYPVKNEEAFKFLFESKEAIEANFGDVLEWHLQDNGKKFWIRKWIETGGYMNRDRWDVIQNEMIDAMIRLKDACQPYIEKLHI